MQGGNKPKNDAGDQRQTDGEKKHVHIERDLAAARQEILHELFEKIETPDRKQHADHACER